MDKMEGLRAGVAEMRSVAHRLMEWADDLEASFQAKTSAPSEMDAAGAGSVGKKKKAAAGKAFAEPATVEKEEAPAPLTLPEVRAILAGKCATGFSTQVKALIESFGVTSLREVPPEHYAELVEAAKGLGKGDTDAG